MRRVEAYRANKVIFDFLRANNVQGKVLLPANICESVVTTFRLAGMYPQFIDIENNTFCVDCDLSLQFSMEAAVLLYSHTYGLENDASILFDQLKSANPNLIIIDDRCLCEPFCQIDQAHLSSNADLTIYSTGNKKQVQLLRGGFGFLGDDWEYVNCQAEGPFFQDIAFQIDEKEILEKKKLALVHRDELNSIYRSLLPEKIQLPSNYQNWRFNILVPNKEDILKAIFDAGLFASGHYRPMAEGCPVADDLFAHVINLFNDHFFTAEQASEVCEVINSHLL